MTISQIEMFSQTAFKVSKQVIRNYSTSFYLSTRLFDKETRMAIYSIYGFVRLADEIVDTFHLYDRKFLLEKFENDYYDACKQGISLNPVLQSFQLVVKKYAIPDELINDFLQSMKHDLEKKEYNSMAEINNYIHGSADVVGLMCLKVFCNGNEKLFFELKKPAMKLGSAYQKINFLRDLRNDIEDLDRRYFPDVYKDNFSEETKIMIINNIQNDLAQAFKGIRKLPHNAKPAVLVSYLYYSKLLKKLKRTPAEKIISRRIRISNAIKFYLMAKGIILIKLNVI